MDYKAFYEDVAGWIGQANLMAIKLGGLQSESYWAWITATAGDLCRKYHDHPLAIKQMMMLAEWLEEAYEKSKVAGQP